MKKTMLNLLVISLQISFVIVFAIFVFGDSVEIKKKVSIAHNDNLYKIADSVSLLFLSEEIVESDDIVINDTLETELSSIDFDFEEDEEEQQVVEFESSPLVSLDIAKYKSNPALGFVVTDTNRQYELSKDDFDFVVAIVAAEYEGSRDDALAVMSVILNRCDSPYWSSWAGKTPVEQVTKPYQFEVYTIKSYLQYMPGGVYYNTSHYQMAKEAVIDGLNGIRNNKYDSFRSWSYITSDGDYYSNNYIAIGGNRYK